jgi:hypothetical protein
MSLLPSELYPDPALAVKATTCRPAVLASSMGFTLHRHYKECPN